MTLTLTRGVKSRRRYTSFRDSSDPTMFARELSTTHTIDEHEKSALIFDTAMILLYQPKVYVREAVTHSHFCFLR
jgi:hypothetical protein